MALNTSISSEFEKEDIARPGPQRFHVWAQNRDTFVLSLVASFAICLLSPCSLLLLLLLLLLRKLLLSHSLLKRISPEQLGVVLVAAAQYLNLVESSQSPMFQVSRANLRRNVQILDEDVCACLRVS